MSAGALTVTVNIDTPRLIAELERAGQTVRLQNLRSDALGTLLFYGRGPGAEARMHVRGGLDPRFTTPKARDEYAQILAGYSPELAAAFLRGWVTHRRADSEPVTAWYRLIGATRIEVTRERPHTCEDGCGEAPAPGSTLCVACSWSRGLDAAEELQLEAMRDDR